MAPGLRIVKRQAGDEEEEEELETTIATKIFGKHLHKVKVTTSTIGPETEGTSVNLWLRKIKAVD